MGILGEPVCIAERRSVVLPLRAALRPLPAVCAVMGGPAVTTLPARVSVQARSPWLLYVAPLAYVVTDGGGRADTSLRVPVPVSAGVVTAMRRLRTVQLGSVIAAVAIFLLAGVTAPVVAFLSLVAVAVGLLGHGLERALVVRPVLVGDSVVMWVSHQLVEALESAPALS